MIEHHIQREIINRLMFATSLRFSELKPDGMESNIFMYHLKQLMREGYVEKTETAYRLASKGLTYVNGLSSLNKRPRSQPKLIAIIAVHDKAKDRWLLAQRKAQPYIGTLMFPSGKQHLGETSAAHAIREQQEKLGYDTPLTYRGFADIQITDNTGELLTHVCAQVYSGEALSTDLPPETERFRYVWHDFKDRSASLMPGTQELQEYLVGAEPFTIDIRVSTE